MFLLYNGNGSGSQEARLVEQVHDVQWGLIRRNASRILRNYSGEKDAARCTGKNAIYALERHKRIW
jgi:hypothetical protein